MNHLDSKINKHFPGQVVRKDLAKDIKGNAIVPSYVLEYLLGQYCATDDDLTVRSGIEQVKAILKNHYVHRNEARLIQSKIKEKGRHKVIDKISAALNQKEDVYEATFSNLGLKKVIVSSDLIKKHPRLLVSGIWCIADMEYLYTEGSVPYLLTGLKPIQVAHIDFEEYIEARRHFTLDQWIDLLIQTIGFNPGQFDRRGKLLQLLRLVPYCERNYNIIELGPKGTGKSHIYSEFSPHGILISGGEITVPKLFVNNSTGKIGLVGYWDAVAFDEFAGKKKRVDKALVDIMKNYMANKSFSRGIEQLGAEASMVFVGNTSHPLPYMLRHSGLFDELPEKYHDSAFLDRLHFYLPGWEVDILRNDMFTGGYGFVVDYLAEILRSMRSLDFTTEFSRHFQLFPDLSTRDQGGIKKTFSGLMKILFPHREIDKENIRMLLEFAVEGRKRVKDQLMRIDATYARVRFGYTDIETGQAFPVQTREEQEHPHHYHQSTPDELTDAHPVLELVSPLDDSTEAVPSPTPSAVPVTELIKQGESRHLEFKSTMQWDVRQNKGNKELLNEIAKTVCGFLNSEGGTLLIGVQDDGSIYGLENDYKLVKNKNRDGFELRLMDLMKNFIGPEFSPLIHIGFEEVESKEVCIVEVKKSPEEAFVKIKGKSEFYIRSGNRTEALDGKEIIDYVRLRNKAN